MPIKSDLHNNHYYYYSIPTALVIALVFLNYLAMSFGTQSRLRREALSKMEEVMASEHELLSLGGQAAAAAHSLGTPLSTIKIIAHDLEKQFHDQEDVKFWVTADKNRIPILVKAKIPVGTVKMHLVEWNGLKNPLTSKIER